ncbi:MAG: helix-turn-helix transcriptional regulator [Spirochaetales bacterium]|nr:helix-turn-helix transcriptional regulator [Spirochaetales bacterium]MBR1582903.1 helix-turn-helix transcriptional regulator [Spirochaetales bacterium]MBR6085027.1 helix-turn-helix transcriptional regulator [Spirochaetales bacterium]
MTETFGQRFSRFRKAKGFTQDDIANKVNVSSQAVSKWENDINMPDVGILLNLGDILGVTTDELLGKENPVPAKYEPEIVQKDFSKLMLRVIVDSHEGDKIRVNLPLQIVKIAIEAGAAPAMTVNGEGKVADAMASIDWKQVYSLIEQGLLGEIVTVDSADGDKVRIVVE